jgi:hypothetical protein
LNGDGQLDLVILNTGAGIGGATVLLGRGDGTFQLEPALTAGKNPTSLALAGLNGDGNLDVVVIAHGGHQFLSVFLGKGDGTFASPSQVTGVPARRRLRLRI